MPLASPKPSPPNKSRQRLQKFMAACGAGSRRACESMIQAGRVTVNGRRITQQGQVVDPETDAVSLDGRPLKPERKRVFAFHKPRNVVSTLHDPQGRPTVGDYLTSVPQRLTPVGRLDFGSEGLLLVTNDGELAHRCMHPRHHVEKVYICRLDKPLQPAHARAWRTGVEADGERLRCLAVTPRSSVRGDFAVRIVLGEGRNRHIRRMAEATGYRVLHLKRIRVGGVSLGDLPPGQLRELTEAEVKELYRATRPRG